MVERSTTEGGRQHKRRHGAWAALILALALSGCAAYGDSSVFDKRFWDASPLRKRAVSTDYGLSDLARGDYRSAEVAFENSLRGDARDPYALLGLGMVYQNTGRPTQARSMYESVLALNPPDHYRMLPINGAEPRPVAEIASTNLARLSGGPAARPAARPAAGAPPGAMSAAPSVYTPRGAGLPDSPTTLIKTGKLDAGSAAGLPPPSAAESAVISRFETLKALLDNALITPDEYQARRNANVGALLPLSQTPPSAGLDRPVPPGEQIVERIRAIGRALEMRAITVEQHTAERTMILDSLIPAAPTVRANPGVPPTDLMKGADAIRSLERVKAAGLVSTDEYAKEKAAIELAMQPKAPPAVAKAKTEKKEAAKPAGKAGVHLASYDSEKKANAGWTQMRRAHKDLLGKLKSEIEKVALGPPKGSLYRLKAGPLASQAEAKALCDKLKKKRQFCEPATFGK